MSDQTASTIALEFAIERLRQERETFEEHRKQGARWFLLRLLMGYAAAVCLPLVAILCAWIILHPDLYNGPTVVAATSALLVDVLGLLIATWKLVLNPGSSPKLAPVTLEPSPMTEAVAAQPVGQP